MEFKIIYPCTGELEQIAGHLPSAAPKKLPGNVRFIEVKGMFGEMAFQHYAGDGFDIWYSNYQIRKRAVFIGRDNAPILELHIQFLNTFATNWDGRGNQLLRPFQFNLTYAPFMNNESSFPTENEFHTFDIHFSKAFLARYAHAYPLLEQFLMQVEKGVPAELSDRLCFLDQEMILLINGVLKKRFRPEVADFYLEAKVQELLVLAVEKISGIRHNMPVTMTPRSIEQMHEVRRMVVSDFEHRLTIPQLARKVGTNEFKLKQEFKQLFGASVFEYMQNERLEKARQLLSETRLSVAEISFMIGYEHVRNFSSAFRKKFGFSPSQCRR